MMALQNKTPGLAGRFLAVHFLHQREPFCAACACFPLVGL